MSGVPAFRDRIAWAYLPRSTSSVTAAAAASSSDAWRRLSFSAFFRILSFPFVRDGLPQKSAHRVRFTLILNFWHVQPLGAKPLRAGLAPAAALVIAADDNAGKTVLAARCGRDSPAAASFCSAPLR